MFSEFAWPTRVFHSTDLRKEFPSIGERQRSLANYDLDTLRDVHVLLIGAGGMGSAVALPLARKGLGCLEICDADYVEEANLCTQEFNQKDLGGAKAFCLARRAAQQSSLGTRVRGHHTDFTSENAGQLLSLADVGVCLVDNDHTRAIASRAFRAAGKPIVHAAVNRAANYGWVFVQEATGPCLGCLFPSMVLAAKEREPCRSAPAVIDILRVVGALALYAVDSLVMPLERHWNFRSVHLVGGAPDCVNTVAVRGGCGLCHV